MRRLRLDETKILDETTETDETTEVLGDDWDLMRRLRLDGMTET